MRLIRFKPTTRDSTGLVINADEVQAIEEFVGGDCIIHTGSYCARVGHTFDEVLRMLDPIEAPNFAWPVRGSAEKRVPVEFAHSARRIGALKELAALMNHVDNTPYSNNFIAAITDYVSRRKSEIETGGE